MMNRTQMINNFESICRQLKTFNALPGKYRDTNLAYLVGQAMTYADILDSRTYAAMSMYADAKRTAEKRCKEADEK